MSDQDGSAELLVTCLCASWCTTCSEFRDTFDRLQKAHGAAKFVWLDVEGDSALMGEIEIESFPTLAVFRGETALFYGVTMPHEAVVARTLASLMRADASAVAVPEEIAGLPGALRNGARA
jgi:thioredoxin reductase (NADPH)